MGLAQAEIEIVSAVRVAMRTGREYHLCAVVLRDAGRIPRGDARLAPDDPRLLLDGGRCASARRMRTPNCWVASTR